MDDLISIIIPVYKVEQYIEECLNSLQRQSYKNFEAILIDDGSPDNCGEICDNYANKDDRFIVIHKKNEGVSKARNVGLNMARGKYITFLDSDDYLHEDAIKNLYNTITENQSDMGISGVQNIRNNSIVIANPPEKKQANKEESLKMLFEEKIFQSVIWAKIYTKQIIGEIRFSEDLVIAEDFDFLYRVFKKTNNIAIDTYKFSYFYRFRDDSVMRQKYNKNFEKEIDLSENVLNDILKECPNLKKYAIRRYQRVVLSCMDKYFRQNKEINGVKYLLERINKYPMELTIGCQIKFFLIRYFPFGLYMIYKKKGIMQ